MAACVLSVVCTVYSLGLMLLVSCRYEGELSDTAALSKAVQEGLASRHYCQIIVQLCSELKETNKMEESVSPPQGMVSMSACHNHNS